MHLTLSLMVARIQVWRRKVNDLIVLRGFFVSEIQYSNVVADEKDIANASLVA
jgi:hypothetical protein